MQDNKIIERVGQAIGKQQQAAPQSQSSRAPADKQALTNAINQLFAELELTFHNQFHKAFPSEEKLSFAKKLWFDYLKEYSPERILLACRKATRESEFLPTVHSLIKHCEVSEGELGLPDAYLAYIEACQAPNPKTDQQWSHPAIYWAGKASDWFFLANNIENKALPVFKRNYELLCERVKNGEVLSEPVPLALPAANEKPLSDEEKRSRIKQLRTDIKL